MGRTNQCNIVNVMGGGEPSGSRNMTKFNEFASLTIAAMVKLSGISPGFESSLIINLAWAKH